MKFIKNNAWKTIGLVAVAIVLIIVAAATNKRMEAKASNRELVKEERLLETKLTAGVGDFIEEETTLEETQESSEKISNEENVSETESTTEAGIAVMSNEEENAITEEETPETDAQEDEYSDLAIADVDNYVNVRKEPNTDSEIVGKMYDDSVAQILEVVGEGDDKWFQVISGSVEGYIKAQYFIYGDAAAEVIDQYVIRYAVVKADRLNVRKEPTTDAKRIGFIDYGEKVKILESGDEWLKVLYTENEEGYVSAQYVNIEEQFVYAKSIEEERIEKEEQEKLLARNTESDEAAPEVTKIREVIPPTDYSNVSELRQAIVNYAMQFVGGRYIHGGQSLQTGTDCSGFTCYTYAAFGYGLSRTPQGQWGGNGRNIPVSEIQPGDIVCYSSNGGRCTHVALYIGNGQVVHAFNPRAGITVSNMYYDNTFIGVKNVID